MPKTQEYKKGVDAMMHRINVKDTPRLLEIALQPVAFSRLLV